VQVEIFLLFQLLGYLVLEAVGAQVVPHLVDKLQAQVVLE